MKRIITNIFIPVALILISAMSATAQWSNVGNAGLTPANANWPVVATDAAGAVYVAYSDNNASNKLSVRKFSNNSWANVGNAGISAGNVEHISMVIDGSGNIVVGYRDNQNSGKLTVMRYNGTSWSAVGGAGVSDGGVYYVSVVVDGSNNIYAAYQDNSASGKVTVRKYTTSWANVGSKGFTNQADFVSMDIDGSGNLYVGYRDNNTWKASVMKYTTSWATLGTAGFSASSISGLSLAVDGTNKPYVIIRDNNVSNKATVMAYGGTSWANVGTAGFSANQVDNLDIAFDAANKPFVSYRDFGNNQYATVMSYNGTSWGTVTKAGFSANQVEYVTMAIGPDNTTYVCYRDNSVGQKATVMKHGGAAIVVNNWTGNTSTTWTTASNWSTNTVPTSSDNVKIPSGRSRYPNITTGTVSCKNIEIVSGASVKVDGGQLNIAGTITAPGTFNAENGTIELNGAAVQTIPAGTFTNNTIRVLELDNSAGASLGDTLKLLEAFKPTKGILTTNNKLVLRSTSTRTAYVGKGNINGSYISGNVTVERFIKGRRAFRFFAHPFGNSIALSQLTDDIDITGSGGSTNGFTTVQVNAPSAYYFDVTTADNSTSGNNPGWKDFKTANSAIWDRYEMARIMFRGSKGQGLTGTNYTPNDVVVDMYGDLNQGDKLIGLDKGANSYFVIAGNPFASPVNMKNTVRTNLYSAFAVWDPYMGNRGAYVHVQFSQDYILPAYAGFVAAVSSGTKGWIDFEENSKSTGTPDAVLKTTEVDHRLELTITDTAGIKWDGLIVDFDSAGMTVQDTFDMVKLNNPDVDFYTMSSDNQALAIDTRPFEDKKSITIGFMPYMDNRFALNVPLMEVPAGTKLYLYDRYLNKTEEMTTGFTYWFDVKESDSTTYGENRFFINMVDTVKNDTTTSVTTVKTPLATRMQLVPNPAQTNVKISFDRLEGTAMIRVCDLTGKVVFAKEVNTNEGSVIVPVTDLPNGMYIVDLLGDKIKLSSKLIKQ